MTENSDETAMGEPVRTTAVRLQEIKARLDAATPVWKDAGEWFHDHRVGYPIHGDGSNDEADAELIAHAPEDLRFLLAEVERLQNYKEAAKLNGIAYDLMKESAEQFRAEYAQAYAQGQADMRERAIEAVRLNIREEWEMMTDGPWNDALGEAVSSIESLPLDAKEGEK